MNPFYRNYQQQAQQTPFNLQSALQNIARQIPAGMTAEQLVRQKVQNGEMTQEQFDQYSRIADSLTGRNRR